MQLANSISTTMLPLLFLVFTIENTFTLPFAPCPDLCRCNWHEERLSAICTSYDFLKKLSPEQLVTLTDLTLSNSSLSAVDPKLVRLTHLKFLNLSDNHLERIDFTYVPPNLETLDLSTNLLKELPKDIIDHRTLKNVYLHRNPYSCNCDFLAIYEQLSAYNIEKYDRLTCDEPKEFRGRAMNTLNCSTIIDHILSNYMLGDEPYSGDSDVFEDNTGIHIDKDDEEFLSAAEVPRISNEFEGSGDEGSGFEPNLDLSVNEKETAPRACHINCSTAKPIGEDDEKNASPPPPLGEQLNIIVVDLFGIKTPTTKTTTTTTTTTTTEAPVPKEIIVEKPVVKTDKSSYEALPSNKTDVMKSAPVVEAGTDFTYVVIGVVLVMIFLLIVLLFVKRNRRQRKRNVKKTKDTANGNGVGEEMKLLNKTNDQKNSEEPKPTTRLLNGSNEKPQFEEIELRDKGDRDELLTPQLERVTIRASELPDSIPKTPMLVHRSMNGDGEIVTTALVNDN